MLGQLYMSVQTGAMLGWLVITRTERGVMPPLNKMHWVWKEDGKLRGAIRQMDYNGAQNLDEDTEIEPHRAAFIRSTLALWEQEYLETKS